MARVGWPVPARKSSLLMRGRFGSALTGPGPLGGGRKSCPLDTQPVPLSGAKFGGMSPAEAGNAASMVPPQKTINEMEKRLNLLPITVLSHTTSLALGGR